MQTESALGAHRRSSGRSPSGLRRLSLAMLATGKMAADFKGTSEGQGATRPGQVLAAFKAAAPHLGLSPRVVHAIDWLFTFTQPQDWCEGSRPVVWPSAALQRDTFGLEKTQAKMLNRYLVELGLVMMKDSPNGKRYGKRDRQGRIVEAYGFDLSPLFTRLAEFQAVAERGRALRERMRHLRRRATIARNGLLQILDTAAEQGLSDLTWRTLEAEGRALACSLRTIERIEEMEIGVASLERRQREALERLETQLASVDPSSSKPVNSDPKEPENRPHQYNYKPSSYPQEETVVASKESKSGVANTDLDQAPAVRAKGQQEGQGDRVARTDNGTVLRIKTDELVQLAPRLRPYLRTSSPAWPDIVEAADWLRHDLGVSKSLWGDACLAMGREKAAIALAIVSAKPEGYFTASPGSYFHGMVAREKAGTLNLARTLWGLRENPRRRAGSPPRQNREKGEFMNS
ncbi:plasmid replication protein RepC [Acidisphaera sp. S103]|uniref:plasmid replication protein RepC n=1 Tax=Acidisphaera sp. S103 TaxID=1747223 RepID=UPI00131DAF5F|nr:plasmid replication protein RepC [Acidisphaera sp. S103]